MQIWLIVVNPITIFAKYSDNTEVDITNEVTFSTIDTSTEGVKELTISYKGYTAKLNVNVLTPTGVELNTTNVIKLYELGQKIDLSNVIVYNVFGEVEYTADSYSISIKDPDGNNFIFSNKF